MKDAARSKKPLHLLSKLQGAASDNSVTFRFAKCTNVPKRTNNQLREQYIDDIRLINPYPANVENMVGSYQC
jgi:hypothetical protein